MRKIRDLIEWDPITNNIGTAFLAGYGSGALCGTIVGLSRTTDELPMITLNDCLNTATKYASDFGYTFGIASGLHTLSRQITKDLGVVQSHAIAGGVAGAAIGSNWGMKGAIRGGAAGAAIGAVYGFSKKNGYLNDLFIK